MYTVAYAACAFYIYLLSLNRVGVEKMFIVTLLILLSSFVAFMLSLSAKIFTNSKSLCMIWKQNLEANYKHISKPKYIQLKKMHRTVHPLQIVLGSCMYLDELALIPFLETVLDKAILLWQVFPK